MPAGPSTIDEPRLARRGLLDERRERRKLLLALEQRASRRLRPLKRLTWVAMLRPREL